MLEDPECSLTQAPRIAPGLKGALLIAAGFTLARAPIAAMLPLAPDEAYYWLWSKRLAWGYFDHPPMVAWMIALSTRLFGDGTLAVRLPALLCGAVITVALAAAAHRLSRPETADRAAAVTALLVAAMPLSHAASLIITPDSPAAAFWALALCALAFAQRGSRVAWIGVGAALGLALLSKYTAVLLGVSAAGLLLASPAWRPMLAGVTPWAGVALAFALFAPVVLWNRDHAWVSFLFQFHHGTGGHGGVSRGVEFLGSQLALLTPTLALLIGLGLARMWRAPLAIDRGADLLLVFSFVPTFLLFTVLAFKSKPEANWAAFAYLGAAVIAGMAAAEGGRWPVGLFRASVALSVAASLLLSIHAIHPLVALKGDRTRDEFAGWPERAAAARTAAGRGGILLGDSYRTASELAYYGGEPDTVGVARDVSARLSMFDVWPVPVVGSGGDAVFVAPWYERAVPTAWAQSFAAVEPLPAPGVPATMSRLKKRVHETPTRAGSLP